MFIKTGHHTNFLRLSINLKFNINKNQNDTVKNIIQIAYTDQYLVAKIFVHKANQIFSA